MNIYWKLTHWFFLALLLLPMGQAQAPAAWQGKVDVWVLERTAAGPEEFILYLGEQADLTQARQLPNKADKGAYVYQQLSQTARLTQKPVLQALERWAAQNPGSVEYRSYWVANMIWVRGDAQVLQYLARQPEISHVFANPSVQLDQPEPAAARGVAPDVVEWNIAKVGAPEMWKGGVTGQGVVIGGQDTGYAWDHPALKRQYRGWDGTTASHAYNWHDAIHTPGGGGVCGPDSPVPCDDGYHGTHTMGTMVGDSGGDASQSKQIGMAPGARWIGCRNMDQNWGKPSTYTECYQWFIAPTDQNDQNPRPDLAPHVINNSWSCPPAEGCVGNEIILMNQVVANVRAAGILSVHSAGNDGPSCGSINTPAAIYDASFTVGNTMENDQISSSSSRGPALFNGMSLPKPDISAPGTNIKSSVPGGYSHLSGTSMAGPHVAGMAALLISTNPALAGQPDQIEALIKQNALPLMADQDCGGVPGSQVPNNTYGWGRIDVAAFAGALDQRLQIRATASDAVVWAGETITFTIQVANISTTSPTQQVQVSKELPANTTLVSATQPFTQVGRMLTWELPLLNPGQKVNLTLVVQATGPAGQVIVTQSYSVTGAEVWPATAPALRVPVIVNPTNGEILYFPTVGKQP